MCIYYGCAEACKGVSEKTPNTNTYLPKQKETKKKKICVKCKRNTEFSNLYDYFTCIMCGCSGWVEIAYSKHDHHLKLLHRFP